MVLLLDDGPCLSGGVRKAEVFAVMLLHAISCG